MVTNIELYLYEYLNLTPLHYFVGLQEKRSLQNEGGYTTRIARSYFGCCCQHKVK